MIILEKIKKHKIRTGLFVLFVPLFIFVIGAGFDLLYPHQLLNPFKITNPHASRFDPMKFRFEDYKAFSQEQLEAVLEICDRADSIEYLDRVFVKSADANGGKTSDISNVRAIYSYSPWYRYIHEFTKQYGPTWYRIRVLEGKDISAETCLFEGQVMLLEQPAYEYLNGKEGKR